MYRLVGRGMIKVLGVCAVATVIAASGVQALHAEQVGASSMQSCAVDTGHGGASGLAQEDTTGGHGCVVIEYVAGGVRLFETFAYTGSTEPWTVPTGVVAARFWVYGAGGGGTNTGVVRSNGGNSASWYTDQSITDNSRHSGGDGGSAVGVLLVTAGETLTVLVGQGGIGNPDARCLPTVTMDPAQTWLDLPARNTDLNEARASFGGGARAKTHYNTRALRDFPLNQNFPSRDDDECINPYFASGGGGSEVQRGSERLVVAGGGGGAGFLGAGGAGGLLPDGSLSAPGGAGQGPVSCCTHGTSESVSPTHGAGGTGSAGGAPGRTSQPTDLWTRTHWNSAVDFVGFALPRVDGLPGSALFGGASLEGGGGGGGGCFGGGGGGDGGGGGGGSSCIVDAQASGPAAGPETLAVAPGGSVSFTSVTAPGGLGSAAAGFDVVATCLFEPGTTTCDADGVVEVAGEGTYTLDAATGVVTFAADGTAPSGPRSPVTYRVTDAFGRTATSTLTPTVALPPVAVDDVSVGSIDTDQVIDVLSNDSATDPAVLLPTSVRLCGSAAEPDLASCTATTVTVESEGVYTVNADGTVTFGPQQSFSGDASPVRYVVSDSTGQLASATITVSISPPDGAGVVAGAPSVPDGAGVVAGAPSVPDGAGVVAGAPSVPDGAELPRTGSEPWEFLVLGASLSALGLLLLFGTWRAVRNCPVASAEATS